MARLAVVLGFYGAMVCSASAADHWSAESCKHLQAMKADTYAAGQTADVTAWMLLPILRYQKFKCGVDVEAELKAGQTAIASPAPEKPVAPPRAPRPPVLCDTTPKAYGGSYTDCF